MAGKRQLIVWTEKSVNSLDPATGKPFWRERYLGGPSYAVPTFDVPESDLVVRTYRNPHPLPIDAPILFLNTFDLQHFTAVHGTVYCVNAATFTTLWSVSLKTADLAHNQPVTNPSA